jgi:hypothetical protein
MKSVEASCIELFREYSKEKSKCSRKISGEIKGETSKKRKEKKKRENWLRHGIVMTIMQDYARTVATWHSNSAGPYCKYCCTESFGVN